MAVPASFEESNAVLGKPADMSADECEALSVLRVQYPDGKIAVVSCWKLTAEELAEINRTGRVWLTIMGVTMPPAFIGGTKPF
jgi:hypothetical protein